MKFARTFSYGLLLGSLFVGFLQCSSAQKPIKIAQTITLQKKENPKVYFQYWVAGVQGGGSGINLVISKEIVANKIPIKAFFRNKEALIETKQFDYVARFKTNTNQEDDNTINTVDKKKNKKEEISFHLNNHEAVLSYLEKGKIKYLKLINIPKKEMLAYPSAPPNK